MPVNKLALILVVLVAGSSAAIAKQHHDKHPHDWVPRAKPIHQGNRRKRDEHRGKRKVWVPPHWNKHHTHLIKGHWVWK